MVNCTTKPLHFATTNSNKLWVDLILLKDPKCIEIKNANGWTSLIYSIKDLEIFEMLVDYGANIDDVSNDGSSILSEIVNYGSSEKVEFLLSKKANPNKGKPSPLVHAIKSNNRELIEKLLDAGADAFKQDESGLVPFVQAALVSSLEIFHLFLERTDCNINIEDKNGVSPLLATLFSGNRQKIEAIQSQEVSFPRILSFNSKGILKHILNRATLLNDVDMLNHLFLANHPSSPDFEHLVFKNYVNGNRKVQAIWISCNYCLIKVYRCQKIF